MVLSRRQNRQVECSVYQNDNDVQINEMLIHHCGLHRPAATHCRGGGWPALLAAVRASASCSICFVVVGFVMGLPWPGPGSAFPDVSTFTAEFYWNSYFKCRSCCHTLM